MRYSLVIFDFDGTLVDSLGPAVAIFNRLAPELRLKPIEDLEAARNMPTRQLLRHLGVRFWRIPRLVRTFQSAAAEMTEPHPLHEGIAELISQLQTAGHRLGILSSNREDVIRNCLRSHHLEECFSFVVGYPKLFGKGKALTRILKSEKIERERVLYVGDELRDVEASHKAGLAGAAVTWGFHAEGLLRTGKPTYVVHRPAELLELVSRSGD